jgi:hypothetical protein
MSKNDSSLSQNIVPAQYRQTRRRFDRYEAANPRVPENADIDRFQAEVSDWEHREYVAMFVGIS